VRRRTIINHSRAAALELIARKKGVSTWYGPKEKTGTVIA